MIHTVVRTLSVTILVVVSILVATIVATLVVAHGLKHSWARERNLLLVVVLPVATLMALVVEARRSLLVGVTVLVVVLAIFRQISHFVVPLVVGVLLARRA